MIVYQVNDAFGVPHSFARTKGEGERIAKKIDGTSTKQDTGAKADLILFLNRLIDSLREDGGNNMADDAVGGGGYADVEAIL